MSEMASYQSHIGPWPIKRAHSVPEPSASLFTPRNSPPSLAHYLANIERNHDQIRDDFIPKAPEALPDWSNYSMDQHFMDCENGQDVDKKLIQSESELTSTARKLAEYLIYVGVVILVSVPFYLVDCFKVSQPIRIVFPKEAPPPILMYILACMYPTLAGAITICAWKYFDKIVRRRFLTRGEILKILAEAFACGLALTMLWIMPLFKLKLVIE